MTREVAKKVLIHYAENHVVSSTCLGIAIHTAIEALEQEPCEDLEREYQKTKALFHKVVDENDAISRQAVLDLIEHYNSDGLGSVFYGYEEGAKFADAVNELPPVTSQPKIGHCKDCKQWKDSDGVYRRGVGAESQCPINRKEVFEGDGYCFLFEPQERSESKYYMELAKSYVQGLRAGLAEGLAESEET